MGSVVSVSAAMTTLLTESSCTSSRGTDEATLTGARSFPCWFIGAEAAFHPVDDDEAPTSFAPEAMQRRKLSTANIVAKTGREEEQEEVEVVVVMVAAEAAAAAARVRR